MIQVKLPTLYHAEPIELVYATSRHSGYGHKTITIELEYKGVKKDFHGTINNMPDYDDATELEGDEKVVAFYNLISHKIEEMVQQWIEELEWPEEGE